MKILSITFQNFGAFFGEHKFTLTERGLVFVSGDNQDEPKMSSNGSGKSTIFDALDWGLFGVVPKDDDADSVVNEEAGKDCEVSVLLYDEISGALHTVRRFRKLKSKHGVQLLRWNQTTRDPRVLPVADGVEDLTLMDVKETQKRVEAVLGLDREIFHAAVYRAQNDRFDFADATDSGKKEILTRILQLQDLDRWQLVAKEKLIAAQQQYAKTEAEVQQRRAQISALEQNNYAALEAAFSAQRAQQQQQIEATIGMKQHREKEVQAALGEVATAKQALAVLVLPVVDAALQTRAQQAERLHTKAQQEHGGLQYAARALYERVQRFQTLGVGDCAECGSVLTAEHLQHEYAKLNAQYGQALAKAKVAEQAVGPAGAEWSVVGKQWSEHLAKVQYERPRLQQQQQQLSQRVKAESALLDEQRMLAREIMRLQGTVESLAGAASPVEQQRSADAAKRERLQAEILALIEKHAPLVEQIRILEFWVEGLSSRGLKSFVLDSRLQEMSDAANEWIKLLTGGTIWVRFETQTQNKSGKLAERFNVRVFRHNANGSVTERNYRSWSGGEKKRVSLGIDFGLSRLVAKRAGAQYDLLIIDESFRQHIDSKGREAVFDLLDRLKKEKTSIFVIDHDKEMAASFETHVVVRKQGGRSIIDGPRAGTPA